MRAGFIAHSLQLELTLLRAELTQLRRDAANNPVIGTTRTVDTAKAEEGLTRFYEKRAGGGRSSRSEGWRSSLLCTAGVDELTYKKGFTALVNERGDKSIVTAVPERVCEGTEVRLSNASTVPDRFQRVLVNGKVLTIDDIVFGYERIFETRSLYSAITWLGVPMQQVRLG